MNFILNRKIKYYTKEVFKLINMVAIALFIILLITFAKFKMACEVTLGEEKVGYIADKEGFEQSIQDYINEEIQNKEQTIVNVMPQYQVKLIDRTVETSEEVILAKVKENSETTYKFYAVTVDGKEKAVLANLNEAEDLVKELSDKYEKKLNIKIGIIEKVTKSNTEGITTVKTAKADLTENLSAQVKKQEEAAAAKAREAALKVASTKTTTTKTSSKKVSLNGITLSVTPVSGIITSRFGSRESIRTSGHTGLDIAAPKGTKIKAAAAGTVTFAGYSGGYGYLVKISHGNGIVTCYGHCSKLYVSKGDTVSAGTVIAAVGSTGYSTGNHLHFEVVKNGTRLNPQNYLY